MAQLLALEWDRNELRVVAATGRAGEIAVQHADILNFDESKASDENAVGQVINDYLTRHRLNRHDAVVVIGRAGLELRLLSVPPVPENELPDIVRFQAIQQFTNMGDDWPFDFVPTETGAEGVRQVLAAALTPELFQQIRQTCEAAAIRPRGIVLRACGTATLVRHQVPLSSNEYVLVMELLDDSVDLTVLNQQTILVARTVRLPHHDDDGSRCVSLLNEIRRTLAAARAHLKGEPIGQVLLLQDDPFHQRFKEEVESKIKLPVKIVDPFGGLNSPDATADQTNGQLERLAPLLGVLIDELHQRQHAIDFLRPKRPVEPPNRKRAYTILMSGVAAVLLLISVMIWWQLHSLDGQIAKLRAQSNGLDKNVTAVQQQVKLLDAHEAWIKAAPNWLTEIHHLSRRLPPPDQLRIDDFTAGIATGTDGTIIVKGRVDDAATVSVFEEVLRDPRYGVAGEGRDFVGDNADYPWHFEERITLQKVPESSVKAEKEPPSASTSSDGKVKS